MIWSFLRFLIGGKGFVLKKTKGVVSGEISKSNQIVVLSGLGKINFGNNIVFGWKASPSFFSSYSYIESRKKNSVISIGEGCVFSNDITVISESEGGVSIGRRCCVGSRIRIYDSDFHSIYSDSRHNPSAVKTSSVKIGNDVFISENVMILKGSEIGDRSVVGAGSVVTGRFPSDVVIAGNPARVVKSLRNQCGSKVEVDHD